MENYKSIFITKRGNYLIIEDFIILSIFIDFKFALYPHTLISYFCSI